MGEGEGKGGARKRGLASAAFRIPAFAGMTE